MKKIYRVINFVQTTIEMISFFKDAIIQMEMESEAMSSVCLVSLRHGNPYRAYSFFEIWEKRSTASKEVFYPCHGNKDKGGIEITIEIQCLLFELN